MIGDLPLKEKRKARKAIESFVAETTEKYVCNDSAPR